MSYSLTKEPNNPAKINYSYISNTGILASCSSLHDAEAATGINHNSISKVIDKFERKAGEYIWSSQKNDNIKYISKPKSYFHPIQQINANGDVIGEWC